MLGTIALPADMTWEGEFDWPTVVRTTEYTLTGALVVDSGQRQAGRPITLAGEPTAGWVSRATVDAVRTLASTLGGPIVLTLADGRSFQVVFAPEDPIHAEPVVDFADPDAGTQYWLVLRLIEV